MRTRLVIAAAAALVALSAPQPLPAQRPDSSRAGAVQTPLDTAPAQVNQAPITPRRAFLSSLMLPGYGQSMLGRKRSGAMMLALEALSVAMLRESAIGVREAKRNVGDSLIVAYVDATGAPNVKYERSGFSSGLVKARKEHVEDWIAMIVANHLFSATDAFVAALLWDLPAEVAVGGTRQNANFGLRLRF